MQLLVRTKYVVRGKIQKALKYITLLKGKWTNSLRPGTFLYF